MAHELADESSSEQDEATGRNPGGWSGKVSLDRRTYLALGVAATAALLAGSAASNIAGDTADETNVYWTDFSARTL